MTHLFHSRSCISWSCPQWVNCESIIETKQNNQQKRHNLAYAYKAVKTSNQRNFLFGLIKQTAWSPTQLNAISHWMVVLSVLIKQLDRSILVLVLGRAWCRTCKTNFLARVANYVWDKGKKRTDSTIEVTVSEIPKTKTNWKYIRKAIVQQKLPLSLSTCPGCGLNKRKQGTWYFQSN